MLLKKMHQEDLLSLMIFPEIKYSTSGLKAGVETGFVSFQNLFLCLIRIKLCFEKTWLKRRGIPQQVSIGWAIENKPTAI